MHLTARDAGANLQNPVRAVGRSATVAALMKIDGAGRGPVPEQGVVLDPRTAYTPKTDLLAAIGTFAPRVNESARIEVDDAGGTASPEKRMHRAVDRTSADLLPTADAFGSR